MSPRSRKQAAYAAASTGTGTNSPSYLVLTEIFGDDNVSRALYRQGRVADAGAPCSPPASNPSPTAAADDLTRSFPSGESLDLAIGILRTLMNERKATADDIRRVAKTWRGACFGDNARGGSQLEERREARGMEERGEITSVVEKEAAAAVSSITDDEEAPSGESSSPTPAARKLGPRRDSSMRKLNPPKKRKSAVSIKVTEIEGCQAAQHPAAPVDAPPAA